MTGPTDHLSDDLPLLLTGEATRTQVADAAEHLRVCADCRTELVSVVVAHASLTSAQRFAPEIFAAVPEFGTSVPEFGTEADAGAEPGGATDSPPLPDLTELFAKVRAEAADDHTDTAGSADARRSRRRYSLLAAAAVVVGAAAGTGVTYAATQNGSSAPSGTNVALAAYDVGQHPASARLSGGNHMVIDASKLPDLDATHRYEVWLTNSARTAMQPIGWLTEKGRASLSVPSTLMAAYSDIEVSVQRVDAPYTYSGTSVLRGSY